MNKELLEQFNKETYKRLSNEERKKLILQTINNIQNENALDNIEIEFKKDLFGYDFENNKIIIDLTEKNSYKILTGIIHELRHQWQKEKENMPRTPLISGIDYILSPHENDAYKYTLSKMQEYQEFFNNDEYDLYLLYLKEQYLGKYKKALYMYNRAGYKDIENIREVSRKKCEYFSQAKPYIEGVDDIDKIPVTFDDGLSATVIKNKKNNNMELIIPGIAGSIINKDIYITHFSLDTSIKTKDFMGVLNRFINYFYELKDIGIDISCERIYLPPAILGLKALEKNEYENFLKSLNYDDNGIILENLYSNNYDENHTLKRTIPPFPDGKEMSYGINYLQEYSKDQITILDKATKWELELDDLKCEMMMEAEENVNKVEEPKPNEIGFYASYQFKKEYSPQKLKYILAGQKYGLNTFYYDDLNEEEIEQLMMMQLEGFERKDWIQILQNKRDITEERKKLEKMQPNITKIDELHIDDDCNIILPNSIIKNKENVEEIEDESNVRPTIEDMISAGFITEQDKIDSFEIVTDQEIKEKGEEK